MARRDVSGLRRDVHALIERLEPPDLLFVRYILEQAIAAEQAEIDKIHSKEDQLVDLYESKGITKERYFARLEGHKAEVKKHEDEKNILMARMGEC